jgi:hypothetical protein
MKLKFCWILCTLPKWVARYPSHAKASWNCHLFESVKVERIRPFPWRKSRRIASSLRIKLCLVSKEIFPWKILKPRRRKRKGCLPKTSNHILIHVEKCYNTNLINKDRNMLVKRLIQIKVKGSYHAWKAINISHIQCKDINKLYQSMRIPKHFDSNFLQNRRNEPPSASNGISIIFKQIGNSKC